MRALTELATAAGQARDQNRVRRLAADAEAAARTTTDPGGQVLALIAVAKAAAQAGDLDRAEAVAHTITTPLFKAMALTGLFTAAARAGELDRAEALVGTITEPAHQAWALTNLATATAQAGDLDRARHLFARVPIMDPLKISWVKAACHFYPRALEGAWDILASAYAIRI